MSGLNDKSSGDRKKSPGKKEETGLGTFNLLFLKKTWIFLLETQVVGFNQKKQNGTRSKCARVFGRLMFTGCFGISVFKQVLSNFGKEFQMASQSARLPQFEYSN